MEKDALKALFKTIYIKVCFQIFRVFLVVEDRDRISSFLA